MEKGNCKLVVITHNQLDVLRQTVESIEGIDFKDIILVDNASNDGTDEWILQSGYNHIIYSVQMEGYGKILHEIMQKFVGAEDLLILQPGIMLLPNCVNNMQELLHDQEDTGAVVAKTIIYQHGEKLEESWKRAFEYSLGQCSNIKIKETLNLHTEAVLLNSTLLKSIEGFGQELKLPDSVMADIAFAGVELGYRFLQSEKACCFYIPWGSDGYVQEFGKNVDRQYMKCKWNMNYFNKNPNRELLELIEAEPNEEMNVLEIGCDCGVNLLYVKNKYPNAHLYGVEINPRAAEIAKHIAKISVDNIEECNLEFEEIKFDYIIMGDVLEHLHKPEAVLEYCKGLLKREGKIVSSIPNVMHYTVMHGLINGDFTYKDTGLLDRTHIHMFTFNEIMRMFVAAEYQVETVIPIEKDISAESEKFVDRLLEISDEAEKFMFNAFQYHVIAKVANLSQKED